MANEPGNDERPGDESGPDEVLRRSLYRHPLAAIGGALILAGSLTLVVLAALDIATEAENPYRSLITFVAAPALVAIGIIIFLVGVRVQIGNARARGEVVKFNLRVEPTDPRFRRSLWLFLGLSVSFVAVVTYAGFRGYEATDSVSFCGDACHTPMEPQAVAHLESAHAQVACVDCHIGEGGASWVKAKLDGVRQLWGVITDEYDRPIPAPVESMQSAEVICESCHWSEDFKGRKFIATTHYSTDEANSPWTVNLLINVGGGPEGGVQEGIHWHMFEENAMEYIATDEQRQEIGWVRVIDRDGRTTVYSDPSGAPDPTDPEVEVRSFDCMDCHNRPAHVLEAPGTMMDLDLSRGVIDPDLPFIKRIGVDLLNASYETKEEGIEAIRSGVLAFYQTNYPSELPGFRSEVDAAIEALAGIYDKNFFPETNTDYRVRFNNASHFSNAGCFRCHFSDLTNEAGQQISSNCETCHVIVGQGPSDNPDDLVSDLGGLEFRHPVDIAGIWAEVPCTQCHSPYSGY
ncbi:MAG: NapC/NirT family cytochrome c [Acidimicrobiia bacterium]|nr:NapC/NirT family cytochrome c [Acidimicrobiia bacterium]